MLKRAIERAAKRQGINVIPDWRLSSLPLVTKLRQIFEHFGIDTVLDIGANRGQFSDLLRHQVGFRGFIHSFEPDPALAGALSERARSDASWTVYPIALGAAAEEKVFNRMNNSEFNSFHAPLRTQPDRFIESNHIVASFPLDIATLDAMADRFGDPAKLYVKIDTQGFDLEVLKGGASLLRQVPAAQTELSFQPVYDGSPSFTESLSAFREVGLVVSDFFLISSDPGLAAVEFDCLLVRDGRAG
ncbi:MAG: FkbM family methyltransferase [Acetobacteraceae bacterium]|nr:FkbM family methyltransferase [Acetobacteraceae bacterium]